MQAKILAAATVALVALTTPAHAATPVDRAMGRIAVHQQMGFKDNAVALPILERRIDRGGRIYVSCSIVAELGYRWATRHGIPARRVSVLTNAPFDGYNDGHAMLELRLGGRWMLYDLDMNRVAVDALGHRVGLASQMGPGRRWRLVAHDRNAWDLRGTNTATRHALARKARMSVDAWYERAFGVALVETSPGQYAYAGRRSPRVEAAWPGHYRWIDSRAWQALNR